MVVGSLAVVAGCGGDSGSNTPDAGTTPDAQWIVERLDVEIDGTTVCPDGWTVTEPTAVREDSASRIRVRAACSADVDDVLLLFSPLPAGAGSVPCFQATMSLPGGARVSCRANSAVLMEPGGDIVIGQPAAGYVQGTCTCTGDDMGSTAVGGANLVLSLQ